MFYDKLCNVDNIERFLSRQDEKQTFVSWQRDMATLSNPYHGPAERDLKVKLSKKILLVAPYSNRQTC